MQLKSGRMICKNGTGTHQKHLCLGGVGCSVYFPCGTFLGNTDRNDYTSALWPLEKRRIQRGPWELLSAKVACLRSGRALCTGGMVCLYTVCICPWKGHKLQKVTNVRGHYLAVGHLPLMALLGGKKTGIRETRFS